MGKETLDCRDVSRTPEKDKKVGDFLTTIRGGFVLGDGPLGTMLMARHGSRYKTVEEFTLYRPEDVLRLHKDYVEAGAQIVGTNTFSANRVKLTQAGLADRLGDMNRLGVALAREAAGGKAWVVAKLGPTGQMLEPFGELTFQEAKEAYVEQASILAEAGADALCVETMSDLAEARAALEGAKRVVRLPVVVSFSFDVHVRTMMGVTPEEGATTALRWGADVVGANCGVGPEQVEEAIERMARVAPGIPLWAAPNAGLPRVEGETTIYDVGPDRFADYAERVARAGARVIGACCGSTPHHVRAMGQRLAQVRQSGP